MGPYTSIADIQHCKNLMSCAVAASLICSDRVWHSLGYLLELKIVDFRWIVPVVIAALAGAWMFWPEAEIASEGPASEGGASLVDVALPADFSSAESIGAKVFEAKCSACHGPNASGREGAGPPLVHIIYEPSHHGDQSFFLAVQRGVPAHHWPFGSMPPVEGVTQAEVGNVVAYVRRLQRENGIN